MTPERQLEIAMAAIEYIMRKRGVHLTTQTKREMGNAAKQTGIPLDELKEFFKPIVQKIVDDNFRK